MKTAILLIVLLLLAGVMLAPRELVVPEGHPVITRITISDTPRSFEMDDGSSVVLDRRAIIVGSGFQDAKDTTSVYFHDEEGRRIEAAIVIVRDKSRIHAWPQLGTRGRLLLVVENRGDRKASATVEF
jgi:hypothetical protein